MWGFEMSHETAPGLRPEDLERIKIALEMTEAWNHATDDESIALAYRETRMRVEAALRSPAALAVLAAPTLTREPRQ